MRKWLFGGSPQSVWAIDTAADHCYDPGVAPRPLKSEEQLKAFLAKVKGDSNLQEKLKAAKSPEDVVTIAKEYGYKFTPNKITKFRKLSNEELEEIAAGATCYLSTHDYNSNC